MGRPKGFKTAIVCAWRAGEDDLQATIDSAVKSAPKGATVYAVEDKQAQGPGRTRHRGIEAATDADVIIIIDAHMRFRGDALAVMAKHAARAGLCCALTYHNQTCSFTGTPYAGARIVYRARDGKATTALAGKWARTNKPGPVGCVMGGCYAFRRDWYYHVGQPLSMLPGWGCDEEALSIASWLSGQMPTCVDAEVAHRYRARPPWNTSPADFAAVDCGRLALLQTVVADPAALNELYDWSRIGRTFPGYVITPECQRFRDALLKLPRTWAQWRAEVCESDELDGEQAPRTGTVVEKPKQNRKPLIVVPMGAVVCCHCKAAHDPLKIGVTHTYPNGNRRHVCPACKRPFISHI